MSNTIELKLTRQEAHVVLRALAGGVAEPDDRLLRTWVAERLLRILSPGLGRQPLAALLARGGDAEAKPAPGEEDPT